MKITNLLQKKLFLEKYAKMHNIEQYTWNYITKYWEIYVEFIEKNEGKDLDYPNHKLSFK